MECDTSRPPWPNFFLILQFFGNSGSIRLNKIDLKRGNTAEVQASVHQGRILLDFSSKGGALRILYRASFEEQNAPQFRATHCSREISDLGPPCSESRNQPLMYLERLHRGTYTAHIPVGVSGSSVLWLGWTLAWPRILLMLIWFIQNVSSTWTAFSLQWFEFSGRNTVKCAAGHLIESYRVRIDSNSTTRIWLAEPTDSCHTLW